MELSLHCRLYLFPCPHFNSDNEGQRPTTARSSKQLKSQTRSTGTATLTSVTASPSRQTMPFPGKKGYGQMLEGWALNAIVTVGTGGVWGWSDEGDDLSGTNGNGQSDR